MSAEQFVNDILIDELNAGAVCCGYNYRFAKSAAADSRDLEELCRRMEFYAPWRSAPTITVRR